MPKLILKTGEKAGMEFEIRDGQVLGRQLEAAIHVNDVKASREHAKIVADADCFHLVDMNSTNGTFVNGNRVSRAELHHSDRVRIGHTEFVYHDPESKREPPPAPPPAPEKKVDLGLPKPKKIRLDAPPPKKIKRPLKPTKRRRRR
jgi:pSer/pThr/pTyr-binding forkhead associated (FHA) protein